LIDLNNKYNSHKHHKMYYGFFMVAFIFLFCQSSAQENQGNPPLTNNESAQQFNGYPELSKEKEVVQDSLSVGAIAGGVSKAIPHPTTKNKPEEETLSFNVLYFIIQRFKVSDVID
jgi:hypothetical protein